MKRFFLIALLLSFIAFMSCLDSDTDSDDTDDTDTTSGTDTTSETEEEESDTTVADLTTFGAIVNAAIPSGLKLGSSSFMHFSKNTLAGTCATDYTDCPYITVENGGDSSAGEILMRLWGLDYNDECTAAYLADGTCFTCADCSAGAALNFIKPTMLVDATACASTSTSDGHYVNMGVDPCFFDAIIAGIDNVADCETVEGGDVDISSAIPWYESWGIPQNIEFSSYNKRTEGGMWWTINEGTAGTTRYFLSLDSNWLYAGIKDTEEDMFLFLGTGSPAYYVGNSEDSGINISAYAGTLSAVPASFEAMQVRNQGTNQYIQRMISNGSYLWFQNWTSTDGSFPETASAVATVKDTPAENRCVLIGDSVSESKYVPLADCVTDFEKTSVADLNLDANFTLKIIDGTTAASIDFSTAVTTDTATACLEEETTE